MATRFQKRMFSDDAVPTALLGYTYWYDTGTTEGGEAVYYDETDTYAYWYDGAGWVVSVVADVGGTPTNFFDGSPLTGDGAWSGELAVTTVDTYIGAWTWETINRNRDYSITGLAEYYRENWQLVRSRHTTINPFESQLGETASSLTAYNGTDSQTITPPTGSAYGFSSLPSTPQDFTGYTTLVDHVFYTAPYTYAGKPVYVSLSQYGGDVNTYPATVIDVPVVLYSPTALYWYCIAIPQADTLSGSFTSTVISGTTYQRTFGYFGSYQDALPDDTYFGLTTDTIDFRCVSDVPTYEQRGIEWYKQTQTWQSKSPWI